MRRSLPHVLKFAVYSLHFTIFTAFVPYVLYLVITRLEELLPFTSPTLGSLRYPLGLGLVCAGVYVLLLAEMDLFHYSGGGSPFPFLDQPKRLVKEGIYSHTRNPMYLGTTIEYCGVGFLIDELLMIPAALLILSFALTLYFLYEKPRLVRLFGEEATIYISKTPLLLPRLRFNRHTPHTKS